MPSIGQRLRLAALMAVALALGISGVTGAAHLAGFGHSNNAVAADTSLTTNTTGTALWVTQLGAGTALRGTADNGIAGFFLSTQGAGISGVTALNTQYGVYGGNDAATYNGGAAIRANGKENHGLVASSVGVEGQAVRAIHQATTGDAEAVYAETASTGGTAVEAWATAASGATTGLSGASVSTAGKGISGLASATSGVTIGVQGFAFSSSGYGGFFANGSADGIAIFGEGSGAGRTKATLRINNTEPTGGMATFMTNSSTFATGHFDNNGTGEVLYLTNGGNAAGTGGGDFISAKNTDETDFQFRVLTTGEVRSDVGFNTPAADFAEMLPAMAGLQAGDVLAIGADGRLVRSTRPYQSSVAGVYSTRPGFVGGVSVEKGRARGHVPLAIAGIVPVKVTAAGGAIRPGDLLTSAALAGYAMKATSDAPQGTIIGKALGSLSSGTGTIEVLVLLQ